MSRNRGTSRGLHVVAVSPQAGTELPPEVIAVVDPGRTSVPAAASDFVILQHEFGIYGSDDGVAVLDILDQLAAPSFVVLHTVLSDPSRRQREIVEVMALQARSFVVMSEAARARLEVNYDLHGCPVATIPHGSWLTDRYRSVPRGRPIVLTWGLLGPGKGLEQGIRALTRLRHLDNKPLYVIAGQTHPNVIRGQGERYRHQLADLAVDLGVDSMVRFINRYLTSADLASLRGLADVCLLPYESHEQVTSGALVEAIGARVPVVATKFPHAVELLGSGAGRLVGHDDPAGIAEAIELYLTDPGAVATANAAIDRVRPSLSWLTVAQHYESLMVGVRATAGAA
ncbi:MAG TPA: glycosyltransferase [Acidimicrobiia bacterium]|nr:glycosyltransferase [Acidimicrobiia bacterium]